VKQPFSSSMCAEMRSIRSVVNSSPLRAIHYAQGSQAVRVTAYLGPSTLATNEEQGDSSLENTPKYSVT
jgi:hypothetical protein